METASTGAIFFASQGFPLRERFLPGVSREK
jgi:hypothetical protein